MYKAFVGPLAQLVQHDTSNAKDIGWIPREHLCWFKKKNYTIKNIDQIKQAY